MDDLVSKNESEPTVERSEAVHSGHKFKVTAPMELAVSADITVEATNYSKAGPLAEKILRGRAFAERLHNILEHHIVKVPIVADTEVEVCLESVLLDWPPTATWWRMIEAPEQGSSGV